MANTAITIPFYVSRDGQPLTGAAAEFAFETLVTLDGSDKSASAPAFEEIGGGWYKFEAAWGSAPFDEGDLVGVIDADRNGNNQLAACERYVPVEVRLDFYALMRSVYPSEQDKLDGTVRIMNENSETLLKMSFTEDASQVKREPGAQ